METKPTEGFEKLQFLLQQNPFPPETFGNLLLLYCKYEYYDLAADVLAENAHLTYKLVIKHGIIYVFLLEYLYQCHFKYTQIKMGTTFSDISVPIYTTS